MVTINDFIQLSGILESLEWFSSTNSKRQEDISERLYELIREIDDEEKDVILELTKKVKNITFAMLEDIIQEVCTYIPQNLLDEAKQIYVLPISAEKDIHKVKSGSYISHFLKTSFEYDIRKDDAVKVEYLANVSYLANFRQREKSLIILCDDFIGSGKQASDCIDWYKKHEKHDDTVIFLTIAALKSGIEKIQSQHFDIYYKFLHERGISDDETLGSGNAKSVMSNLERRMRMPPRYRLGFEKSEALIAFNFRAPNNTFPIYWCKTNKRQSRPVFGR